MIFWRIRFPGVVDFFANERYTNLGLKDVSTQPPVYLKHESALPRPRDGQHAYKDVLIPYLIW